MSTLPGFRMLFGSNAAFSINMLCSSAGERAVAIAWRFCCPMPCSAEMLPVVVCVVVYSAMVAL